MPLVYVYQSYLADFLNSLFVVYFGYSMDTNLEGTCNFSFYLLFNHYASHFFFLSYLTALVRTPVFPNISSDIYLMYVLHRLFVLSV